MVLPCHRDDKVMGHFGRVAGGARPRRVTQASHPSTLTGFISQLLTVALKQDAPKYPNYTSASCLFVSGFLLLSFLKHKGLIVLEAVAQTVMSVLREAAGSHVSIMAFNGPQ